MSSLSFVALNLATPAAPLYGAVTPAFLAALCRAVTIQMNRDIAAEWGGSFQARPGAGPHDVGKGEVAFVLCDAMPAPGAVALHDVGGAGVPVAYLALTMCGGVDDVTTAFSHECGEAIGDPECNLWADALDGRSYAFELCDAVQAGSYALGQYAGVSDAALAGIRVSDFLRQAFFAPSAAGPYSFVQACGGAGPAAPFATCRGGYQIARAIGTGETQVHGRIVGAHKLAKVLHPSSRSRRRGATPEQLSAAAA